MKEVFELDRAPTLYVSNFSVCEGEPFEVGRNVYEVIAPFLDKLNVVEGAQSVEGMSFLRSFLASLKLPYA